MSLTIRRKTAKTIEIKLLRIPVPTTAVIRFIADALENVTKDNSANDQFLIFKELLASGLDADERLTGEFKLVLSPTETNVPPGEYYYTISYVADPSQIADGRDTTITSKLIVKPTQDKS